MLMNVAKSQDTFMVPKTQDCCTKLKLFRIRLHGTGPRETSGKDITGVLENRLERLTKVDRISAISFIVMKKAHGVSQSPTTDAESDTLSTNSRQA